MSYFPKTLLQAPPTFFGPHVFCPYVSFFYFYFYVFFFLLHHAPIIILDLPEEQKEEDVIPSKICRCSQTSSDSPLLINEITLPVKAYVQQMCVTFAGSSHWWNKVKCEN